MCNFLNKVLHKNIKIFSDQYLNLYESECKEGLGDNMRKSQSLKRLGATALTMGLLGVGVLPSNSYADEGDITKVQSISSNKTTEGKVLSYIDTVESNEFLTDEEVKSINLSALNDIYIKQ